MKLVDSFAKSIILISLLILSACSSDDSVTPPPVRVDPLEDSGLSDYQKDVVNYFNDITLGFEFGSASPITRKWSSKMRVFVSGDVTDEMQNELQKIIDELNELVTDGFSIELVDKQTSSNYHVFIGPSTAYANLYPEASNAIASNWGLFYVWWDANSNLNRGHMYVDNMRANSIEQRHLLREEFTQSLGLAKDATTYSNSIFQSAWTTTTSYSQIDEDIIALLYHPRITSGLSQSQVTPILIDILLTE